MRNPKDSYNEIDDYVSCTKCDKGFDIIVLAGFSDGYVIVHDLPDEHEIEIVETLEPYYEDHLEAILSNTEFYSTFRQEINNLRELNKLSLSKTILESTLRQQIYVSAITVLEAYLSDAFINTVLSNEKHLKKFVKTYKDFAKEKFPLNAIFDYYEKIEEKATASMQGVIYHHLRKVRGMYKDTLDVELPPLKSVLEAVTTRHDLVHRNGKTKEGQPVIVTKEVVFELLATIENFVEEIDNQLKSYTEHSF